MSVQLLLSGMPLEKSIHVRGPSDGLPAPDNLFGVLQQQLLQALRGAYGLTEAPRQWYLRSRGQLPGTVTLTDGAETRKCGFTKHNLVRKLQVILTLHVDDGLYLGKRSNPIQGVD